MPILLKNQKSKSIKYIAEPTFFAHKALISIPPFSCQNAPKLTYSNVRNQKFSGGETPGPPLQREAASNAAGRGASNAGEGEGKGGGRGGEVR